MMPSVRRTLVLLAFGAAAVPSAAAAGQVGTMFTVSATVLDACSVTATDLAFGSYLPTAGSAATASSTVEVTCTGGSAYTVALDGGTTTGNVNARAMTDGAAHDLGYGLYTTSGYTTVWGDGSASTVTQGGTGNNAAQDYTVYGRLPAGQFVPPGNYNDVVGVTVNF